MRFSVAAMALSFVLQDAPPDRLADHLSYLRRLETAEERLAAKDFDSAFRECEAALALKPADTALPKWGVTGGAAAHVLKAEALAGLGKTDAAFEALAKASENGFTGIDRLKSEAALAPLRSDPRWEEAFRRFRDTGAADDFSGRTVKTPKMGNGLIAARKGNFPKAGERAPDFDLAALGGGERLRLSSFRGSKPVVLIFGSHT